MGKGLFQAPPASPVDPLRCHCQHSVVVNTRKHLNYGPLSTRDSQSQGELQETVRSEETTKQATEQLQGTLQDLLQATARTAAIKVTKK